MKICRAFAAAFVALFLLSACSDGPVADARDAAERMHITAMRATAAYLSYLNAGPIDASVAKWLRDVMRMSEDSVVFAYKAAQAAAVAPTEYAAKQRATDVRDVADDAEKTVKLAEKTVQSSISSYNADKALSDVMDMFAKMNGSDSIDKYVQNLPAIRETMQRITIP